MRGGWNGFKMSSVTSFPISGGVSSDSGTRQLVRAYHLILLSN